VKNIANALGLLVTLPIWYYLMYQILIRVNATELMMFLFWVYVPVGIAVQVVTKLYEQSK
jgi:hypothetical protein